MASFFYLPHVLFVAEFGLDHFDASMRAQYVLTQKFTAEFSVRAFLERHESQTLAVLENWTADANVHVRRLVSEGTRPRLPWARRLRRFQADPAPVLALLERLKDDPEEYVRRSVANNLNDIGKDHSAVLLRTAAAWMKGASPERRALVRHALRSLAKAGNEQALRILGYGRRSPVRVSGSSFEPTRVAIGGKVRISVDLQNPGRRVEDVLVDLRVHFVKSKGQTRPKVFRLGTLRVAARGSATARKTVSLETLTTRRPYAGRHRVELLINGLVHPIGGFLVIEPARRGGRV
jgi:3-methyladenine DNA glycosylase AlkC